MNIALIGSAPSSVMLAPYKDASYRAYAGGKQQLYPPAPFVDQDWEIWACSPGAFGRIERCTRFFELHRWEPGKEWFSPEYCQWLRVFDGPVYTGGPIPEIKNHVLYPLERVEDEFSSYFLTSSLSLMLAFAILEIEDARSQGRGDPKGNDTIGMWGVDMAATEEWNEQRPGCQHFILEALRRGIRIFIPEESDLLRPMPVYGISEWDQRYIKSTARMRELNGRKQACEAEYQRLALELHFLRGATEDMVYNVKTWCSPFGIPAGAFVKQDPGTGMGGNFRPLGNEPKPDVQPTKEPEDQSAPGEAQLMQAISNAEAAMAAAKPHPSQASPKKRAQKKKGKRRR